MKKTPNDNPMRDRFPASLPRVGVGVERWIFKSLLTKFFHDHFLWPD
jgi:hypothetical protein